MAEADAAVSIHDMPPSPFPTVVIPKTTAVKDTNDVDEPVMHLSTLCTTLCGSREPDPTWKRTVFMVSFTTCLFVLPYVLMLPFRYLSQPSLVSDTSIVESYTYALDLQCTNTSSQKPFALPWGYGADDAAQLRQWLQVPDPGSDDLNVFAFGCQATNWISVFPLWGRILITISSFVLVWGFPGTMLQKHQRARVLVVLDALTWLLTSALVLKSGWVSSPSLCAPFKAHMNGFREVVVDGTYSLGDMSLTSVIIENPKPWLFLTRLNDQCPGLTLMQNGNTRWFYIPIVASITLQESISSAANFSMVLQILLIILSTTIFCCWSKDHCTVFQMYVHTHTIEWCGAQYSFMSVNSKHETTSILPQSYILSCIFRQGARWTIPCTCCPERTPSCACCPDRIRHLAIAGDDVDALAPPTAEEARNMFNPPLDADAVMVQREH
jgi:hypothetical protein